ncbi:MAG: ABC transporter ATP-binding protein [Desulfobacterales bacterium]|jgi:ABC-2 type transport system ATP-binding protein
MNDNILIETENLTKVYNGRTAVDRLSFHLIEGEVFGFLGPNGAGKTTTLLMLLGLTEPTAGTVRVLGLDPCRNPIAVKSQIGHLQENMGFYGDLNAWQMLEFIADLNGIPKAAARERCERALQTVGLLDDAGKSIRTFSRGMRQRLGIAELLIKECRIAFMDEPTLGLDPDATNRMMDLVEQLCRESRMTVLLSSHLLHLVQRICHRVGIMIRGQMVACGPVEQLAKEKLGDDADAYTLEQVYMKYFEEGRS